MTRALALFPLLSVVLAACPAGSEDSGEPEECDRSAVSSVQVAVVASDGARPPSEEDDLVVNYAVDGGDVAACFESGEASYTCGVEEVGRFVIEGRAKGYESAEIVVDIELDADGCHPMTRGVELSFTRKVEAR